MSSIEFKNISKKFGNFSALNNISFTIPSNSVFCILGENGAGKSTLMKILSGFIKQDSGEIFINKNSVNFNSTNDALKSGIGMIYQHFMLIQDFTVLENVILGNEISSGVKLDFKRMENLLNDLNIKYKLNLNLNSPVSDLSVSEQQKTEILKLLFKNPDILILDEPTAVLSPDEVKSLFEVIEVFKNEGKTVILITHKLKEVKQICDYVSVLRKGEVVFESEMTNLDINKLAFEITGELLQTNEFKSDQHQSHSPLIEIKKLKVFSERELNLEIRPFEVTAICGVDGNGQNELINFILGIENFECEFQKFVTDKISLIPDDRIKKGFISEFSFPENLFLKSDFKLYSSKYMTDKAESLINKFDIRLPENNIAVKSLSGGNQQKIIIAREIDVNNDVIILHHPTRGVDIKSSDLIYSKIFEEKNKGKAIILISSDLDEIIKLADRISVIYKGSFIKSFSPDELKNYTEDSLSLILGKLMIGIDEN
ncbi:MAG TPA: ABC transporter ATP-binding protein [Ignavibacteria bacterium]|nr:ABC transporter ATP-binding protein [Ignavibacteria bacterium]